MKNSPQHYLQYFEKIILKSGGLLANIAFCAMAFLVTMATVLRYGFGWTPGWTDSICAFLVLFIVVMSAGETLLEDKHIRIKFLYDKLSIKWQKTLDLLCGIISLGLVGFIIYSTTKLALFSKEINATTPDRILLFPLQITVPIGFTLLFIALLGFTIRATRKLFFGSSD